VRVVWENCTRRLAENYLWSDGCRKWSSCCCYWCWCCWSCALRTETKRFRKLQTADNLNNRFTFGFYVRRTAALLGFAGHARRRVLLFDGRDFCNKTDRERSLRGRRLRTRVDIQIETLNDIVAHHRVRVTQQGLT